MLMCWMFHFQNQTYMTQPYLSSLPNKKHIVTPSGVMALAWPQSGRKEYKANLQRALASHVDSRHARAQQIRDFVGHFHIPIKHVCQCTVSFIFRITIHDLTLPSQSHKACMSMHGKFHFQNNNT
jgi:hypothetical protein